MKIKEWNCDACGRKGRIKHPDGEDIRLTRIRVAEDHERVSPLCKNREFNITKGLPKGKSVRAIHDRLVLEVGILPK